MVRQSRPNKKLQCRYGFIFLLVSTATFANLIEINPEAVKNDPDTEKARATRFHAMSSFSEALI
jgi:hypothetical protein